MSIAWFPITDKYRFLKYESGSKKTMRFAKKILRPGAILKPLENMRITELKTGVKVAFPIPNSAERFEQGVVLRRRGRLISIVAKYDPAIYVFRLTEDVAWLEHRIAKLDKKLTRQIARMRDPKTKALFEKLQADRKKWNFLKSDFEATAHELANGQGLTPAQLKRFYKFLNLLQRTYDFPI